jgi:flagellar hook-associated protein 1 FlgK
MSSTGTFFGLDLASRAMKVARAAFETNQHNIANANTPGYSRQETRIKANVPYTYPDRTRPMGPGQVGTGIQLLEIARTQDVLLWKRELEENQNVGSWTSRKDLLKMSQTYFDDTTDSGMKSLIDMFWTDWQEVAKFPESISARQKLLEDGQELARKFRDTYDNLTDLRTQADLMVKDKVAKINDLASQIASLNREISMSNGAGDNPNDLLDQRDQLISDLSKEINISVAMQPSGSVYIYAGGMALVEDDRFFKLATTPDGANENLSQVVWQDTNAALNLNNGGLFGIMQARDVTIKNYRNNLDALAYTIVNRVNELHTNNITTLSGRATYDLNGDPGGAFFNTAGTSARTIALAVTDPSKVAASYTSVTAVNVQPPFPGPGDGSNALAIAQLITTKITTAGPPFPSPTTPWSNQTIAEYYTNALPSKIGTDINVAERSYESHKLLSDQILNQQQQVSGVNMDEEFLKITKFQRQFEAAARLVNSYDDLLNRVVNNLGRVAAIKGD